MFATAGRIVRILLISFLTLIALVFCIYNRHFVSINFFPAPYNLDIPVFLLLLICLFLGAITGWFIMVRKLFQAQRIAKKQRYQIAALHNELAGLRASRSGELVVLPD